VLDSTVSTTVVGLVFVPLGLVMKTVAAPGVAVVGMVKVRLVAVGVPTIVAAVPVAAVLPASLTRTAVTLDRKVPVIVTCAPGSALVGEKLVMVGAVGDILKGLVMTVPPGASMVMGPVVEPPKGTVNVMVVSFTTRNATGAVPSVTDLVPVKPEPVIVITAPPTPVVGVKLVTVGGAIVGSSFLQLASHRLPTTTLAPE
jgi:hypothetical protein